jgi:WD40 repeat protein
MMRQFLHSISAGLLLVVSWGAQSDGAEPERTAKSEPDKQPRLIAQIGHTESIHAMAFSPDGRRILTGSGDQSARLWDVATGKELLQLTGHTSGVRSELCRPGRTGARQSDGAGA